MPEAARNIMVQQAGLSLRSLLQDPAQQLSNSYVSGNPHKWVDPLGLELYPVQRWGVTNGLGSFIGSYFEDDDDNISISAGGIISVVSGGLVDALTGGSITAISVVSDLVSGSVFANANIIGNIVGGAVNGLSELSAGISKSYNTVVSNISTIASNIGSTFSSFFGSTC